MNDTAKITYRISDEEWVRTSGMRWNPDVFLTYYCFHGLVSFRAGEDEVLGTDHLGRKKGTDAITTDAITTKFLGAGRPTRIGSPCQHYSSRGERVSGNRVGH